MGLVSSYCIQDWNADVPVEDLEHYQEEDKNQLAYCTPIQLNTEDLQVRVSCDPTQDPYVKAQILSKMGLSQKTLIEKLPPHISGGQNHGVWVLRDTRSNNVLILKLVPSTPLYGIPSEATRLRNLALQHPFIVSDNSVAFPLKIFKCMGPAGEHSFDFIVMRKVAGEPLTDIITKSDRAGAMPQCMLIFRELGIFLAQFHKRYSNKQHGDFHTSNIYYDASSGSFSLIDIGNLGNKCVKKRDTEYFLETLSSMWAMKSCLTEGKRNFEEGYRLGYMSQLPMTR